MTPPWCASAWRDFAAFGAALLTGVCLATACGPAVGRGSPGSVVCSSKVPPVAVAMSPGAPGAATVALAAAGDIMLDRGVARQIEQFGTAYPLREVAKTLSAADLAFANLECPLSATGTKVHKYICFQARPSTATALSSGGLDILSLANNHTMDCGRTGLVETMDTLRSRGLHWCGAGATVAGAAGPVVLRAGGLKVAFVGFCSFLPEGSFLRDDRPTIAFASEPVVRRAVAAARRQADIVVASFHWGVEYATRPLPEQERLAHAAIAAGADLVLGHHPHVLQGLELLSRRDPDGVHHCLIAYSLGNFVFDSPRGVRPGTADSMILRCVLARRGIVAAQALPVRIENCRPRPANRVEATAILARLATLSGELHTAMTAGHVRVEAGVRTERG